MPRPILPTLPASPPGFDSHYGLVIDSIGEDAVVRAHLEVADHHRQPVGLLHGGVLASIAETVASMGTAVFVLGDGMTASGQSNSTSFLRPVLGGRIDAVGRPRHRGRTSWVWDVDLSDDEGRLCAVTRMIVAVRPAPPGTPDRLRDAPS